MPRCRDIYLKIEQMPGFSPLASDDAERNLFRRDCMFNHGHEDGKISDSEVALSRLDAIVYRQYVDPGYTTPNMAPLISADVNEPAFDRRIPGALVYAEPGERLFVHVLNADDQPHSFHLHGLIYGIDSDGSWPFGVHGLADPGPRSDPICPGQAWTYVFDTTDDTIGAWRRSAMRTSPGCSIQPRRRSASRSRSTRISSAAGTHGSRTAGSWSPGAPRMAR
jgi:hypothetical protein